MKFEIITRNAEQTADVGARMGSLLSGGEIILLDGDLGAGKTVFAKGLARGLDLPEQTPVVSPSFTLVNIYQAKLDMVHIDLYRLEFDEIYELGLEDFMDERHIMVVEWAARAREFFRGPLIEMQVDYLDAHSRRITISSDLPWCTPEKLAPAGQPPME